MPRELRLTWFDAQVGAARGRALAAARRLRALRGFANPGAIDYEGSLFRDGIGATGYVRNSADNLRTREASVGAYPVLAVRAAIAAAHQRGAARDRRPPVSSPGWRWELPRESPPTQWQVFAATGTTHLIAISGLHVTMVAALAMLAARWLWQLRRSHRHAPARRMSPACVAHSLRRFMRFSRASPCQRSALSQCCWSDWRCTWLRRAQPASHVLSVGADRGPAHRPACGSAAGLLAVIYCRRRHPRHAREPCVARASRCGRFFTTQTVVSLALLPATLLVFGSVSLVAPLANLRGDPGVQLRARARDAARNACSWRFAPADRATTCLRSSVGACGRLWPALEWAASLPAAIIHLPTPVDWSRRSCSWALSCCAHARFRRACVCPRCSSRHFCSRILRRAGAGEFTLTTLDVGQGLAVVVQTKSHALLFDAGPRFRNGRSAGELAVVPYLHATGVRALDLMVVSHADSDHAGGAPAVERALTTRELRRGGNVQGIESYQRQRVNAAKRGSGMSVRFEFLQSRPRQSSGARTTVRACCEIASAHGRALLTGDIQASGGGAPRQHSASWRRTDSVVIPHHGSRSSSSAALVDSVRARYAIVSAGARNRWRFPHSEVVERWCRADAQVINTADWGAISIDFSPIRTAAAALLSRGTSSTTGARVRLCGRSPSPLT